MKKSRSIQKAAESLITYLFFLKLWKNTQQQNQGHIAMQEGLIRGHYIWWHHIFSSTRSQDTQTTIMTTSYEQRSQLIATRSQRDAKSHSWVVLCNRWPKMLSIRRFHQNFILLCSPNWADPLTIKCFLYPSHGDPYIFTFLLHLHLI